MSCKTKFIQRKERSLFSVIHY